MLGGDADVSALEVEDHGEATRACGRQHAAHGGVAVGPVALEARGLDLDRRGVGRNRLDHAEREQFDRARALGGVRCVAGSEPGGQTVDDRIETDAGGAFNGLHAGAERVTGMEGRGRGLHRRGLHHMGSRGGGWLQGGGHGARLYGAGRYDPATGFPCCSHSSRR